MRAWLAALMLMTCLSSASALDEIVLKNGRRYLGTIIASTPTTVTLAIDGGTVEFPRSMIASPPYLGPVETPPETVKTAATTTEVAAVPAGPHPLPDVTEALRRLRRFPWVSDVHQVPVLVTSQGRWQFLPCVSFWASDFFQLSVYGDPARPTAIEISLHNPPPTAWEQKRQLLEYALSIVPGMAVDNRFDRLDVNGDQFAIGDLWFEVTGPQSAKTPGRWVVLLLHEMSLRTARASYEDLKSISEPVAEATIDPNKPRSWQRGTWLPAELEWARRVPGASAVVAAAASDETNANNAFAALGGERVFVRSFVLERGHYVRANNDWMRDVAVASP